MLNFNSVAFLHGYRMHGYFWMTEYVGYEKLFRLATGSFI